MEGELCENSKGRNVQIPAVAGKEAVLPDLANRSSSPCPLGKDVLHIGMELSYPFRGGVKNKNVKLRLTVDFPFSFLAVQNS